MDKDNCIHLTEPAQTVCQPLFSWIQGSRLKDTQKTVDTPTGFNPCFNGFMDKDQA